MHIMEGFLPAEWCAVWFIISIPIVLYGVYQIKKITETTPESKALIAVSGAFMFILSSLKLPSVTGSCSHPTGNGFGAVLFGPAVTAVLASIVLIFAFLNKSSSIKKVTLLIYFITFRLKYYHVIFIMST